MNQWICSYIENVSSLCPNTTMKPIAKIISIDYQPHLFDQSTEIKCLITDSQVKILCLITYEAIKWLLERYDNFNQKHLHGSTIKIVNFSISNRKEFIKYEPVFELFEIEIIDKGPQNIVEHHKPRLLPGVLTFSERAEKNWQMFKLTHFVKILFNNVDEYDAVKARKNINQVYNNNGLEDILCDPTDDNDHCSWSEKNNTESSLKPFDMLLNKFMNKLDNYLYDRIPKFSINCNKKNQPIKMKKLINHDVENNISSIPIATNNMIPSDKLSKDYMLEMEELKNLIEKDYQKYLVSPNNND